MSDILPASTQYDQWMGTFAADHDRYDALLERAGLDPEERMCVGFRITFDERAHEVSLFTVDAYCEEVESLSALAASTARKLRVVEHKNLGLSAWEVLNLLRRFQIVAKSDVVGEHISLQVAETVSLPFQDPVDRQ